MNTMTAQIDANEGEVLPLTFDLTKWGASSAATPIALRAYSLSSRNEVSSTIIASVAIAANVLTVTFQSLDPGTDYSAFVSYIDGSATLVLEIRLQAARRIK